MEDLFYLLLGIAIIVLPIYFIVKAIKNKGKKEKIVKEKSIIKEQKIDKPKEKSVGKIFAIIFGGAFGFIFLIVAIALIATGGKIEPVDNSSKMVKEIKSSINVNNEEAQAIDDILKAVGISEIDNIKADESLNEIEGVGSKGYRIKASFSKNNNIILYVDSNNKVICIRWADKDFYRDGKALLNFKDYVITWDEQNEYNIDAQKRIKALLKAPSTAKFPSINNWKFGKDNGIVIVQAYVDSENSYGAKLRNEFQIKYDSNKNVVSLIIDGVEYIK